MELELDGEASLGAGVNPEISLANAVKLAREGRLVFDPKNKDLQICRSTVRLRGTRFQVPIDRVGGWNSKPGFLNALLSRSSSNARGYANTVTRVVKVANTST